MTYSKADHEEYRCKVEAEEAKKEEARRERMLKQVGLTQLNGVSCGAGVY